MTEEEVDIEELPVRARELEREHDWLGAADLYARALSSLPKADAEKAVEVREALAYATFKGAFQSDSNEKFKDMIAKAIERYRLAAESYESIGDRQSVGRCQRCTAMTKYLGFWHSSELEDKKRLASDAWSIAKKALDSLHAQNEAAEYCRTYSLLTLSAIPAINYMGTHEAMASAIKEVVALGEHAVDCASRVKDPQTQALAYVRASSFLSWCSDYFLDGSERVRTDKAARGLWDKAKEISEDITFRESVALMTMPGWTDPEEPMHMLARALDLGEKAKERLVTGSALDWMAQKQFYSILEAQDSDERETAAMRTHEVILRSQKEYAVIGHLPPTVIWAWIPHPDPWFFAHLSNYTVEPKRKRELAEKALKSSEGLQEVAARSGYEDIKCDADLILSIILTNLARTESDLDKKKTLLEKALEVGATQPDRWGELHPFDYGPRSFSTSAIADTEFEFASLEEDPELRKTKLRKALQRKTKACELAEKFLEDSWARSLGNLALGGLWQNSRGACAYSLYDLTKDRKDADMAVRSHEASAEAYSKAGQPSRCAESHWRAARVYDVLGEHQNAHRHFVHAASEYTAASEKVPKLATLYKEHSKYMEAWSEIEQAKHHHLVQEYGSSAGHYEKASSLLASTERWRHLSAHYLAWSSVEVAENLSKEDSNKDAIRAFEEARRRFEESGKTIQARTSTLVDLEEAAMGASLIKAAGLRKDYCRGRAVIEEARLLDKQGQESASSEKYGHAAKMLDEIRSQLEDDQDRKEISLLVSLARAWQTLTAAEAESSPELFDKASKLFEQVKNLSSNEKSKSLALGHSRFCKALGAGTRFSDTAEAAHHTEAAKHLEAAAKYYLKADHPAASEYTSASKLLFDSYAYMDKANREDDPEKKARLYKLTEKVLEASAASYERAKYTWKKEQVLKLLEKARRDRQLALSLTEALHAPDFTSTAAGFVAPSPTHETAAGLDRFEHADVQTTLVVQRRDLLVGDNLDCDIELVNAGRESAQLAMMDQVVPRGFELVSFPERCRREDGCINLRGRRLEALGTEDVKIILKPTVKGMFTLKPRITYLDETGSYRTSEPEPVKVTVNEIGISGWLKGPDTRR